MTTTLPLAELGLNKAFDQLESQLSQRFDKHAIALGGLPDAIASKLASGSATLEDVEGYLRTTPDVPTRLRPSLSQFLRTKRGWILVKTGREEEALADAAALIKSDAKSVDGWTLRAVALLNSERFEEACQSFKTAFEFTEEAASPRLKYRKALIFGWSGCALLWSMRGIINEDLPEAEQGVEEYLKLKSLALESGLLDSVVTPADKKTIKRLPKAQLEAFEELELMVRLLSIENPFEAWQEFTKAISKVWPRDVSAIDAIREQRR